MNKRALMLTAAATALLSGPVYGQTNPNPPCNPASSTTTPSTPLPNQLCNIVTDIGSPIYTGAAPSTSLVAGAVGNLGNVDINTSGEIAIGTNPPLAPAVTLNSGTKASPTIVTNTTTIQYTSVNYAVGVLLEEASVPASSTGYGTAENWTGEFINSSGTINLTGSGINTTGILIAGAAYPGTSGTTSNSTTGTYANTAYVGSSTTATNLGVFTGATGVAPTGTTAPVAIDLESGSTLEVQGTNSFGINLLGPAYTQNAAGTAYTPSGGASLIGDIDIGGTVEMTPTTVGTLTTAQQSVAINIAGWMQTPGVAGGNPALAGTAYAGDSYAMIGNVNINSGAVVSSEGQGAEGIVVLGAMKGTITNAGTLETLGTTGPSTAVNADDPEGGSAIVVANNLTGGIYNAGPTLGNSNTAAGTIEMTGSVATIGISPAYNTFQPIPITIGTATDGDYGNQFSLVNRGTISATAEDANVGDADISIAGSPSTGVTLLGGIFNSGTLSASATTNVDEATTSTVSATTLSIGSYVNIGKGIDTKYSSTGYSLINSNETGTGTITASVSGTNPGVATAISIAQSQNAGGGLASIFNSGTIAASASTTTPTITGTLNAFAIADASGTLTTINNEGTISATATLLDSNNQSAIDLTNAAVAINVSSNSTNPVTINDNGVNGPAKIVGDIYFGTQPGTLTVQGASPTDYASVGGSTGVGDILAERIIFYNETATPDTLTIGANGSVSGIIEEANSGSVNISIAQSGSLYFQTTAPTNLNATVASAATTEGKALAVNELTVSQGGLLTIGLSQSYNTNAFPTATSVINAQTATIGGNGVSPSLAVAFQSYVAGPSASNSDSTFVLISTPKGALSVTQAELNLLSTTYNSANTTKGQTNGVPFLFSSSVCAFNVAGATAGETCSGSSSNSEIVLTLAPKSAQQLGLTGYALQMFKYANEALVNDNTLGAAMVNDITGQQQAQAAYSSFAPDVSGATRATAISLTDSATNIVAARQRELRMYVGQEGDTTLWGQQFGQRLSEGDKSNGLTGYNDNGFGFAMGLDDGDPVDGRYGGAFTFFSGGMSEKEPISAKTEEEYYLLTGYTDWRGKGLFVDTQASVGYGNLKGKRYLTLTDQTTGATLSREADGNRPTELLAGGITTGGIFNAGGTVLMPQLSVDGLTMREEGYTENNGGQGFDLRVQPYYANSLRAFVGGDVREDINFGDFFLQPELRAGYRYDFVNGSVKLKANFASVSAINTETIDQFSVHGPDPGHGNIVLGGGLATTTGAWSLGVSYDYVKSNQGPTEQTGLITILGRI